MTNAALAYTLPALRRRRRAGRLGMGRDRASRCRRSSCPRRRRSSTPLIAELAVADGVGLGDAPHHRRWRSSSRSSSASRSPSLFAQSRTIERALFPYAVTLQVTPIVAIAPLILIWVGLDNAERAVLILATIVAFFPILANTTLGLRSADRQLHELFDLYRATRLQTPACGCNSPPRCPTCWPA